MARVRDTLTPRRQAPVTTTDNPARSRSVSEATGGGPTPAAGPVVVLTYSFAGGKRLQALLEREPTLACTTGMGILGMCDAAARAWRNTEDSDGERMSSLAINSIRSMVSGMLAVLMARTGARRWCETASAELSAAEAFLQVFPGTRFICLQRSCPDLVHAVLESSPWGMIGGNFVPYMLQQPANAAAAIAAWWVDYAGPVLDFETRHPQACLRVRYEDLVGDPDATSAEIFEFIGIPAGVPAARPALPGDSDEQELSEAETPGAGAAFPAARIPPNLIERVNELHAKLGYPSVSAAT